MTAEADGILESVLSPALNDAGVKAAAGVVGGILTEFVETALRKSGSRDEAGCHLLGSNPGS